MKKSGIIVLLSILLVVSACSGPRRIATPDSDAVNYMSLEPYKIGISDQLNIVVWRNDELSVQVPVRPDGKISIPLIGDVIAAGREVPELATALEKGLGAFVRSPKVTVIVTQANNAEFKQRVRLTGAVLQPLSIPYREGITVLDLVLQGGGLSEFANANNAKLYRKTGDGVKTYHVYLKDIMNKGDLRTNYNLVPSDIVTVPESAF